MALPPEDQIIAIDQLLRIKTDEVAWSLNADTLRSIDEALELTDVDESWRMPGMPASREGALAEFRTEFKNARDRVAEAFESAAGISRGLEYGLAEAYRTFGNAEAQATATVMAMEQTEQWKKEATPTLPGPGWLSSTFAHDWREKMSEDGGYRQ